jgi:hypothetical protein
VRVNADGPAVVTLPHYYFPVGWEATFFGRPTGLKPSRDGLMTTMVVGQSVLEARFHTTPARRTGLLVSGATLLLVIAGVAGPRVRNALVPSPRLD